MMNMGTKIFYGLTAVPTSSSQTEYRPREYGTQGTGGNKMTVL